MKEPDFSCGYITVIENVFGFKQELPLVMGDNVIGRRNKDTDGVDVPIITSDPSMGRKHCVINVKEDKEGKLIYTLRDFPSLTGTFLCSVDLSERKNGCGLERRHCNDRCYLYSSCTGRRKSSLFYLNLDTVRSETDLYIKAIKEIGKLA